MGRRLLDQPPTFHVGRKDRKDWEERVQEMLEDYRQSLSDSVCTLIDSHRLQDFALKVVGIGSVGTRCFVGLFFSAENHPLLVQFKEACASVLEPFAGKSRYEKTVTQVGGSRRCPGDEGIARREIDGRAGSDARRFPANVTMRRSRPYNSVGPQWPKGAPGG
jgi:hypothetical protein